MNYFFFDDLHNLHDSMICIMYCTYKLETPCAVRVKKNLQSCCLSLESEFAHGPRLCKTLIRCTSNSLEPYVGYLHTKKHNKKPKKTSSVEDVKQTEPRVARLKIVNETKRKY